MHTWFSFRGNTNIKLTLSIYGLWFYFDCNNIWRGSRVYVFDLCWTQQAPNNRKEINSLYFFFSFSLRSAHLVWLYILSNEYYKKDFDVEYIAVICCFGEIDFNRFIDTDTMAAFAPSEGFGLSDPIGSWCWLPRQRERFPWRTAWDSGRYRPAFRLPRGLPRSLWRIIDVQYVLLCWKLNVNYLERPTLLPWLWTES